MNTFIIISVVLFVLSLFVIKKLFKLLLLIVFAMLVAGVVLADSKSDWKVTRTEKIYANQEVKIKTGSRYVCKDVQLQQDALGRAIILAIAGSMIDSEHALLGAITGLLTSEVTLKRLCYDEILYDTRIERVYVYTLVTMSNGITETQHKIYE